MKSMKSGQKGFTIIELVVVILLLGILAATALPRFIDVSDEANTAVVQATASGLTTAANLYRAEWVAEGSQAGVAPGSFATTPTAAGYPAATDDATCGTLYTDLLQTGAAPVTATYAAGPPETCSFALNSGAGTIVYDIADGETTF